MCTKEKKTVNFGIRIDKGLAEKIDNIVKESEYLNLNRTEVIESILKAFFKSDVNHLEKSRELVIRNRKGSLNIGFYIKKITFHRI